MKLDSIDLEITRHYFRVGTDKKLHRIYITGTVRNFFTQHARRKHFQEENDYHKTDEGPLILSYQPCKDTSSVL